MSNSSKDVTMSTAPGEAKEVKFSPDVQVKRTLHVNNYTDDEFVNSWYDSVDFQVIREEIDFTVKLFEKNDPSSIDEKQYCIRGLEFLTKSGARRILENRADAVDSVLEEQDDQWEEGETDDEALADAYHDVSRRCLTTAHMLGLFDEKEVYDQDIWARGNNGKQEQRVDESLSNIMCFLKQNRRQFS